MDVEKKTYCEFCFSGRKKKDKGGGMIGGMGGVMMTMVAMGAQMMIGKFAFLAGAALILSKVSLMLSIIVCFFAIPL